MLGHIYIKPISGWLKNSREERSQDFGEFNERAFWARGQLAMAGALFPTLIIMHPALCSNGDQVGVNDDNDGDG